MLNSSERPLSTGGFMPPCEIGWEKPRILLAASDSALIEELKGDSEVFDAHFETATLGMALPRLPRRAYDIIVADLTGQEKAPLEWLKGMGEKMQSADVILIADSREIEFYREAMRQGAFDCFARPYCAKDFQKSLSALIRRRRDESIDRMRRSYEGELAKDRQEFDYIMGIVEAMVLALEARDRYTRGHSERVTDLSVRIAGWMGCPADFTETLRHAARLHDIGKIGIVDAILKKSSELTGDEREIMMNHPLVGEGILRPALHLAPLLPLVRHHHERFDGQGYPDGLEGGAIPLGARIISLADAYDAMRSDRPYRVRMDREDAIRQIEEGSGSQFDPAVVEAFRAVVDRFDEGC